MIRPDWGRQVEFTLSNRNEEDSEMAIIRWNPLRQLTRMERELRRIMRHFDHTSDEPAHGDLGTARRHL
jgi:hypothetical protein